MAKIITPTVGRVVHFYADPDQAEPMCALVTGVQENNPRGVDLTVFPPGCSSRYETEVRLIQPCDKDVVVTYPHAVWMPYQVKKDTGSESGETVAGTQVI